MGYGTGVLRAYYACYFIRGLSVGIAGTSSLYIAERSGLPQHLLVGSRGLGLTLGPMIANSFIGKLVWSGNSEAGVALALFTKMIAELAMPRVNTAAFLYTAFFFMGAAIATLDTMATVLMMRVHGSRIGNVMVLYDTVMGIGTMVAPWIVVMDPDRAWDVLAAIDFTVFAAIASKRTRRGKPTNWKAKIRGADIGSPTMEAGSYRSKAPLRVVRAGIAFTFLVQATMTAVSCWGFTYAAATLQLPPRVAALIPSLFYASCTAVRFVLVAVGKRLVPSTLLHAGCFLALVSAVFFLILDHHMVAGISNGASAEWVASYTPLLVLCFMMMGAGFCPHYSLMLAAMQRHGDLDLRGHSWYGASTSFGVTVGMWIPGYISLPYIELAGSLALMLIITSHIRDFPLW